ncbi:PVC-type heme-binding CxxCH protein [Brevifollis gellanilyticus]|uniref:Cytochrome c n=1 Tax=Brevifollis gellanilyticus TaxID=748831 RepID=A0A512M5A9_9BACT|nr:PVC-type heme-binding CxxCH protein [Brevifollis gellanilyticus]GEP41906.1 cytochrome c [Brevifollis gellanilyticus]
MKSLLFTLLAASCLPATAATQITWKRQQLHGDFYSEGAAIGDINGDGKPDVVSGPFWWEGPAFEKKHAFYEPKIFSINGYSDNFFAYVHDFNGDQKNDILVLGFPGKEARLYLNVERTFQSVPPGAPEETSSKTRSTYWPMHIVADVVDNESPVFTDITGDGKPEIVCSTGGSFGWFAPNWEKPTEKWNFIPATDDLKVAKFTHGLGVGDVDGDGKMDLLEARRWWENTSVVQASGLPNAAGTAAPLWSQHNFAAGIGGGAQMFAYDFDGNGTNDVFTSLAAHRYGVAVFLQNKTENREPGTANWQRIMLATEQPQDNDYGIVFSQPHAAYLADIDGDGVKDIVTGKRYWAHNGHDPDERGARVIYWYQTKRDGKGGVDFVPHLVDAESGVGVDVQVGDVNGDKLPDIVVGNKAGVYILTQERKETTADLTPKKLYGPALKPQKDYAKGQSPQDALKAMQLPGGFKAELIAAEPDVVQPIAFTFDERGRIWVVEGNSYPKPREVGAGQDRIKILEDKDGDGTYETNQLFCEGLNLVSGIELGFGGVWVGAAPYLMFIPRDGDKPLPLGSTRAIPGPSGADGAKNSPTTQVPGINFTAYALLDGWGSQDTHETLNSFIWGPDGWLYGCHGVFTHSKVGKPGTPDDQRQPINAGIWRYHPVRHEFEIFAHGTSNPWGLDYDQHGEWFVTACVIPHLYHIVPGGRYQRQAGQHFNAYTYEDIKTIADHAHYAGNPRPDVSQDKTTGAGIVNNDTNALGGGHAHCGLAIYQSSQFPLTYRNQLLFGNLHGHRLVANYTDPHGSTYTGKHGADFMRANDMHFIPVTQKVGPDGSLYVSDWSDQQICHRGSNAVENWDRSNGRIYRVSYDRKTSFPTRFQFPGGEAIWGTSWKTRSTFDLAKESDETLAKLAVQTENEWFSRMARRVLMERSTERMWLLDGDKGPPSRALSFLSDEVLYPVGGKSAYSDTAKLRAFWTLKLSPMRISLQSEEHAWPRSDAERAWAIRMLPYPGFSSKHESKDVRVELSQDDLALVAKLGNEEKVPVLRREFASLLQRLPQDQRKDLAASLLKHGEDKDDPMIPLLIWYGIEPVVAADAATGLQLASVSKLPKVTEFIYRRMASEEAGRQGLLKLAAETNDNAQRDFLLQAVLTAARGGSKITQPANWSTMRERFVGVKASADAGKSDSPKGSTPTSATQALLELEAHMGIDSALKHFRDQLASTTAPAAEREAALSVLLQARDAATSKILLTLIQSDAPGTLKRKAIQALTSLKDPETPQVLSAALIKLPPGDLPDAINTLASTKEGSIALLKAVEAKTVPSTALSPFLVRQLAAFKDAQLDALIKSAWGDVNAPKADLAERTKKYRDLLTPAALAKGDAAKGKILFMGTCGACHKLLGEGQNVGPDITGSNRADLNYLLENVLDPNAVIGKAYQLNLFTMKDGRVMSGVIKEENPTAVKIAMMGGIEFTLPQGDIEKREVSKLSTMPEGLFDALPSESVIDLVKYLQSGNVDRTFQSGETSSKTRSTPGALEGESLKVLEITGGTTKKQGMGGFGNRWSGGSQLWWTGGKPDDKLTLVIPVKESGKYALHAALTMAKDYGVTSIMLDGKPIASSFDGYNADKVVLTDELDWGTHELTAGDHQLTFTLAAPNPAAKPSNMVGLDYVRLEKK